MLSNEVPENVGNIRVAVGTISFDFRVQVSRSTRRATRKKRPYEEQPLRVGQPAPSRSLGWRALRSSGRRVGSESPGDRVSEALRDTPRDVCLGRADSAALRRFAPPLRSVSPTETKIPLRVAPPPLRPDRPPTLRSTPRPESTALHPRARDSAGCPTRSLLLSVRAPFLRVARRVPRETFPRPGVYEPCAPELPRVSLTPGRGFRGCPDAGARFLDAGATFWSAVHSPLSVMQF